MTKWIHNVLACREVERQEALPALAMSCPSSPSLNHGIPTQKDDTYDRHFRDRRSDFCFATLVQHQACDDEADTTNPTPLRLFPSLDDCSLCLPNMHERQC